jgi:hypothetical protein
MMQGEDTEISFWLHYQQNLSENPWCAVIGLSLPSVVPRKWIFSHILLLVAPKTDFWLLPYYYKWSLAGIGGVAKQARGAGRPRGQAPESP